MPQSVHVHYMPDHFRPETLRGGVAVVLDILRASTTIVHALAAGAERVIPCETIDEARAAAANLPAGSFVLGGERHGTRIDGFDLGNSPLQYAPERVGGKTVVFTTTNGTRALARCREAERILIGSLVNCRAVAEELARDGRPVHLVCAGTDGKISMEDVLCAGGLTHHLESVSKKRGESVRLEDTAWIARDFWRQQSGSAAIEAVLKASHGGRNLLELGYDADVTRSSECDRFTVIPEYDRHSRDIIGHGET